MPRSKGRTGRPWRRIRARVLADWAGMCHVCGHAGATDVDHLVPLSMGGPPLDPANLRPAHGVKGCPTCKAKCNQSRGAQLVNALTSPPRPIQSRLW